MKIFILVCLLVILAVLLCDCSRSPTPTEIGIEVNAADGSAMVQEVFLKDGTRCAVIVGYSKGGIDCEWRNRSEAN